MRTLGIAEFKAKCIGIIHAAHETGVSVVITHRGRPVARLEPILAKSKSRKLGALKEQTTILGDVMADFADEWESQA